MTTAPLPAARSGILGLLPTVVQVTAEAGVGFYFRCAGGTALWVTDSLCEYRKKNHIKHRTTQSSKTVSAAVWPALHVEFSVISTLAPGRFFFPYLAPTNPPVGAEMHSAGAEQFPLCGELTDKHVPAEERGSAAPEGC